MEVYIEQQLPDNCVTLKVREGQGEMGGWWGAGGRGLTMGPLPLPWP